MYRVKSVEMSNLYGTYCIDKDLKITMKIVRYVVALESLQIIIKLASKIKPL